MRLVTLTVEGEHRPGVLVADRVLDLAAARRVTPAASLLPADIIGLLAAGSAGLGLVATLVDDALKRPEFYAGTGVTREVARTKLAAPLPAPRMVLAVGANYHEHLKEMNAPPPATPMCFQKSVASVIGPGDDIVLPRAAPDMVDWEGEFAVVIGKRCHDVSEAEALDHVAGYTIVNDVSARDWVAPAFTAQGMIPTIVAWEHNILGKLYPTFCPMGPVIVTPDEIADPGNLKIVTRLNGDVMQSSNTSDLVFGVKEIISYYSRFLTFEPGDVISTGSPSGVGYGMRPQKFMRPGDVIEVTVQSIGTLSNRVVA